jgi:hypothetical protein
MIGIDLEGVEDAVSALADPLVAQAVVLGFEDPEAEEIEALVDAGLLNTGVTINMYLANAANAADIAKAPVNGARVVLETPEDAYGAPRTGEGTYRIDSAEEEIEYADEDEWMLWADAGREKASRVDVILPPAAEIDLPKHHDEGKDLELDLTGQGYNSTIIWVYDDRGIPTWGNYPENITEVYNRSLAAEPLEVVTIPGAAFPHTGIYALGIAAMVHNSDEQLIEVNALLSRGMSGKTRFFTLDVW